ncbi:MAG: hypothetical protein WAN60_14535, partial [Candidatus Sulfotelmatobacter sp.]
IQPSRLDDFVIFFRVERCAISGPVPFCIQPADHAKSQSMESRIKEVLESFPPVRPKPALETMEHLALLKRWYYRGSRTGEIFFADEKGDLPMRRIVRGISRVYRGETPEVEASSGQSSHVQPNLRRQPEKL